MTIRADDILPLLLAPAVELQIMRLQALPHDAFDALLDQAAHDASIDAPGPLYHEEWWYGERPGTAQAFNDMAKVVALLAFVPGGVTVFNQHYEARRG